ncbi:MAG: hypothetical protein J6R02_03740 [Alistipes sp.]|nr:hypothetical protein [Alistipes sp.]MBO5856279.1 hypothetical protein [Alistipes sp.]
MINIGRIAHLLGIMSLIVLLIGCTSPNQQYDKSSLISQLQQGDIIFRRGTGIVGHAVAAADRQGNYSHVGIVVSDANGFCVVHAVPHEHDYDGDYDRVKCERIDDFLNRYVNADVALFRPKVEDGQRRVAVETALRLYERGVPFDHDYDLSDTTRLYCTELVEYAYLTAGISLSEGRRTEVNLPIVAGRHIMPSDLTESTLLEHIINL